MTRQTVATTALVYHWRVAALLLLGMLFSVQALAGISARLDRSEINEGETVVLNVVATDGASGTPDVTALAKDFDLVDQRQSMQMSMINGRSTSQQSWQFVLAPRTVGTFEIPPIAVGSSKTDALTLKVLPAAQAAKQGNSAPVLLEAEATPNDPYVQQKVIYTVRVLTSVPLSSPSLSEPHADDTIIERLGGDAEYQMQRGGKTYHVVERRYALFPQRSGDLKIVGPTLDAQVPDPQANGSAQRDPFSRFDQFFANRGFSGFNSMFSAMRPLRLRAANQELKVSPPAANAAAPWLPAESLSLNDSWAGKAPTFRVGEPVTRTIAITAQGLSAAQLPDLTMQVPADVKVYPDKTDVQSRADGDTLIAQKTISSALVPSKAGPITLPAVDLNWWDVNTKQAQVAHLPARQIDVLPAANAAATAPAQSPLQQSPATAQATPAPLAVNSAGSASSDIAGTQNVEDALTSPGIWRWVAAALAVVWVLTLLAWWASRRKRHPAVQSTAPVQTSRIAAPSLSAIESAFKSNDAAAAREALLDWAAARWPGSARRLDVLATRLGPQATEVIRQLDACLYSADASTWDGAAAWQSIGPLLQTGQGQAREKSGALPPLYPQQV